MDLPNRIIDMINLTLPNSGFSDNPEDDYTVTAVHGVSRFPFLFFAYEDGICYMVTYDTMEPKLSIVLPLPENSLDADCLIYDVDGLHLAQLTGGQKLRYPALMEMTPFNGIMEFHDNHKLKTITS